jgi:L,D-transpeptidase ErfK/SrfK
MKTLLKTVCIFSLCLSTCVTFAADIIIGGETMYVVQKKENLYLIGAKHGVFWKTIARDNNIDIKEPLTEGTVLKFNTRRIVPKTLDSGIIINIPDRTLYFFKAGTVTYFPVGLGLLAKNEISDWRTPTGKFYVTSKRKDPTWYVPESIQLENTMKRKEIEEIVPPGPNNPLGKYAIEISIPATLIHATIWPGSVYRYMSHGCIRMLPEHIEQLYPMVDIKTKGEIIYEPVKLAINDKGTIYLEVRTDVYKKHKSIKEYVSRAIETRGISDKVDWQKIDKLIQDETGVAEDITLPQAIKTAQSANNTVKISFTQKIVDFIKSCFKKSI